MEQSKNQNEYYKRIGFLCGLEIHQRLATREKLFCACAAEPAGSGTKPIAEVLRYQRAVAGELGTVDRSTQFESSRQRAFTYKIVKGHTCLVDIDEEPPHELNREALDIALAVTKGFNCSIVDEIEPMRKEVVDGSDPSAFQRTMLIGSDGFMRVDGERISIPSIFLEEESSGIETSSEGHVVYNTDRLGIPLVEIDTDKYIPTPRAAKAAALQIGLMLRITGRVQRGIGTIRQDVNVSIKDGARIELKGIQELNRIDRFVENEVLRQQNLISIKQELAKRGAHIGKRADVTSVFTNTNSQIIKENMKGGVVLAMVLHHFKGMLGYEINPSMRLGTEISDYAKKAGVKGLIHSDEDMQRYGISASELDALSKALGMDDDDAFIIIAGKEETARKAMEYAVLRAEYAMKGVPEETRIAHDAKLCTSRFQRPLPGGSRMYPETDMRPVLVTEGMLKRAENAKPDIKKVLKALKKRVGGQLAMQLVRSTKLLQFEHLSSVSKAGQKFIANLLLQQFTELRRNGYDVDAVSDEHIAELLDAYSKGTITKQAVPEVLKVLSSKGGSVEHIIISNKLGRIRGKELAEIIKEASKELKGGNKAAMVEYIMSRYRLNVDGSELNALMKKKDVA
ncbi:MAG: Glu-tRNA(Gln) amidotransferase subunit GatE [Candidatus Micrarchaeia archaeon]